MARGTAFLYPRRVTATLLLAALLAAAPSKGPKKKDVPEAPKKLRVGTKPAPPFAIKGADGTWSGISIELWRDLAKNIGHEYELKEYDLKGLLNAIAQGDVDVGIAAITLTPQREQKFDFSHPFFFTGLGIAISAAPQGSSGFASFFSPELFRYLGGLVLLLFVVGILIWVFERRRNSDEFRPGVIGISDGFWWSAVTMTTVGYGDAAPKTLLGRLLGLVWMFAAILIISIFTAGITSALTVSQLESGITGPDDLPKVKVGSVDGSSSQRYLSNRGMVAKPYPSVVDGLKAVAAGEIDAFVYDRPLLQYYARTELSGRVRVLDAVFDAQSYGIGLPSGSPLRERVNTALLELQTDEAYWGGLVKKYLGE